MPHWTWVPHVPATTWVTQTVGWTVGSWTGYASSPLGAYSCLDYLPATHIGFLVPLVWFFPHASRHFPGHGWVLAPHWMVPGFLHHHSWWTSSFLPFWTPSRVDSSIYSWFPYYTTFLHYTQFLDISFGFPHMFTTFLFLPWFGLVLDTYMPLPSFALGHTPHTFSATYTHTFSGSPLHTHYHTFMDSSFPSSGPTAPSLSHSPQVLDSSSLPLPWDGSHHTPSHSSLPSGSASFMVPTTPPSFTVLLLPSLSTHHLFPTSHMFFLPLHHLSSTFLPVPLVPLAPHSFPRLPLVCHCTRLLPSSLFGSTFPFTHFILWTHLLVPFGWFTTYTHTNLPWVP